MFRGKNTFQSLEDNFSDLFKYYYPKLKAFACRFVDEQTAEDITQDIFLMFWNQNTNTHIINVSSYLFRSVQNACLNHIKHKGVQKNYELLLSIALKRSLYMEETLNNDVWANTTRKNILEVINQTVDKLPPKCAEVFRYCYFGEMAHKEIADLMNISVRTVEAHIRNAITILRKELKNIDLLLLLLIQLHF